MMNAIVALTPLIWSSSMILIFFLKFQKNAFNALLQWCTCPNPCRLNLQSLPAPVKRRLKALKKVQLDATKIEAKFYEEVHKLECKYHEMYKPLYEKRTKITKGKYHINYKITSFLSDECHCGPILTPLMNSKLWFYFYSDTSLPFN